MPGPALPVADGCCDASLSAWSPWLAAELSALASALSSLFAPAQANHDKKYFKCTEAIQIPAQINRHFS